MTSDERHAAMDRLASAQRAAARLADDRRIAEEAARVAAHLRSTRETAEAEVRKRRATMHAIEGGGE